MLRLSSQGTAPKGLILKLLCSNFTQFQYTCLVWFQERKIASMKTIFFLLKTRPPWFFVVCIFSMYEKEQLGTKMFQRNLIWKEPTYNWLWIKWKEAKRVERLLVQPQLFKYWSEHIDLPSEFNETTNTANLIVQESSNLSEFHIQYVAMRNVNVFTFPLTLTFNQRSTKIILLQMLIYS